MSTSTLASVSYFSSVAELYAERSRRGLWAWVRASERRHAEMLLPADLAGQSVLDVCSGAGFYSVLAWERGCRDITALDASLAMLERIPISTASRVVADAADFRMSRVFDWILCAGGLEFIHSLEGFFSSCAQVSHAGTRLLTLTAPNNPIGWVYQGFHSSHGVRVHLYPESRVMQTALNFGWVRCKRRTAHAYARLDLYERS